MIVTIFRSRLRPEYEKEYNEWAERTEALARTMPGFVSMKTFYAKDGERVSIVEFESEEAHEEWRSHPVNLEAQRLGREKFYSEFKIQVMNDPRSYGIETVYYKYCKFVKFVFKYSESTSITHKNDVYGDLE